MRRNIERHEWIAYFDEFNRRNRWRPTRLEAIVEAGAQEIERGLPFVGIRLDESVDSPNVDLLLGDHDATDPRHLTYVIRHVRRVASTRGADERDELLEVEDGRGEKRVLSFEPLPSVSVIY
jgi:hypothetical protein